MRINHNIAALNTYRQLSTNNTSTQKSLEKLSSGLSINRAGDNAAGLAISEKMRGQIRGLDQASSNANDGISLIQTAEGALNETQSILQRMRELAVQSSNDTNTSSDRLEIQKEIDQLTSEIDRIGNTTEFNTKKLLNGGAGISTSFSVETVGGANQDWISVVGGTSDTTADNTDISITDAAKATQATTTAYTLAQGTGTTVGNHVVTINGYSISFTGSATEADAGAAAAAAINAVSDKTGVTAEATATTIQLKSVDVGSAAKISLTADAGAFGQDAITASFAGTDADLTSLDLADGTYTASGNTITVISGDYKGLELKINSEVASDSVANAATFRITGNGSLALQIGANAGQEMGITIQDMRAEALGVNALNVTTQTSAKAAITTIQSALDTVSSERAKLGAYQNRLEHTINNLGTTSENLSASESRIRDVDMAKEMMSFTKNNILSQAAQAMLAQANQQPQSVLQLLQ